MTPDPFRRLARRLPEAVASAHMGTPDCRMRGKIFATLGAKSEARCIVKFTLEQQEIFRRVAAHTFAPVEGGWGRKGWTLLHLRSAKPAIVRDARTEWRNVALKKLVATLDATGAIAD